MKRFYIVTLCCLCALFVHAQDELYRYDRIPDCFQQVFNDMAAECVTCILNTSNGQYWGQARDGVLYGYGIFISNDGSQWVGQYRNGECIFGILMSNKTANVGSKTFYSLYDLTTGELLRIQTPDGAQTPDPQVARDYRFESMTYANGDRYVGETYKGQRHGYGIYYWSDGQFWYGQYHHNVRCGYGVQFGVNNKLFVGKWFDNEKQKDQ